MQSATTMGSPATASTKLKQLVYQLHGAEFAVGDLGIGVTGIGVRSCLLPESRTDGFKAELHPAPYMLAYSCQKLLN